MQCKYCQKPTQLSYNNVCVDCSISNQEYFQATEKIKHYDVFGSDDNLIIFNNMQKRNSFDAETVKKIIKGALIAMGGALLTYLAEFVSQSDFGSYTHVVVAVMAIVINALREYQKGE